MKTHSFLRDEMKLSAAVTLVVFSLMSGSLLYGAVDLGGNEPTPSRNGGSQSSQQSSTLDGSGSSEVNKRCYHQVIPCPKMGPTCRELPYALEVSCSDFRCTNGGACIPTSDVGLPGQDGFSLFLKSICSLTENPCDPADTNCLATPVISQVSCDDNRCSGQIVTTNARSVCTRTRVIVDRDAKVVGSFNGWVPVSEQNTTSGGTSGGNIGGVAGSTNNNNQDGSNVSGEVPGPFPTDGDRKDSPIPPGDISTVGPARGCFTRNGVWTTDRAFCDPNQGRFVGGGEDQKEQQPTDNGRQAEIDAKAAAEQEAEVRRLVEEKFRSKAERDAQLASLLATTTDAIERLSLLVNREILPIETAQHVQAMIDWLKQVTTAYSFGEFSIDEIQTEAIRVQKSLADTQRLITESLEQSGVTLQRNPDSLLTKTDRIFAAIPTVLSLLQEQQVPVAPEALTVYQDASALYEEIKPACQEDPNQCLRLVGVVERLQQMMDTLRASMNTAGRSDLEEKINILFQSM